MPRKAAVTTSTDAPAEPRRSSRIKERPKADPLEQETPAKSRTKKVKPAEAKAGRQKKVYSEELSKLESARGKKRTAADKDMEDSGAAGPDDLKAPPAKKAKSDSKAAAVKPPFRVAGTTNLASKSTSMPVSRAAFTTPDLKAVHAVPHVLAHPPSTNAKQPGSQAPLRMASKAEIPMDENHQVPSAARTEAFVEELGSVFAPPSIPSSFLASSSDSSSSHFTSISRANNGTDSFFDSDSESDPSSSLADAAQLLYAEALKLFLLSIAMLCKSYANPLITLDDRIFERAIATLNTHASELTDVEFVDIAEFLTTVENKHRAILFSSVDEMLCKHLLQRYLAEIATKKHLA